jgi:hypothetical protein
VAPEHEQLRDHGARQPGPQARQAAGGVDEAELPGRRPEIRLRDRDAHVTAQRELQPAAERRPVQRGDHRHRAGPQLLERRHDLGGDRRVGDPGVDRVADRAQVVAGGEDRAGAGQDDAAVLRLGERAAQRREDLLRQRAAALRALDAQQGDALGGALGDQAPRTHAGAHGASSSLTTVRPGAA